MDSEMNPRSLDTLCAALAGVMGIPAPASSADADRELVDYVFSKTGGKPVDRIFMYNPDAIGQWVFEKYPQLFSDAALLAPYSRPYATVMPSVTPVCFGTMYTGAQPEVHGICAYKKPVIRIETLFDALIRAGKKPAIIGDRECSMTHIFLERDMDYYLCDSIGEINATAARLISEDKYDFIACYNGNYDSVMHKTGPESIDALAEARANVLAFSAFVHQIRQTWKNHNTLFGFAMDHGCHEIDGGCGSHGLYMPEDINICHLYGVETAE